MPLKLSKCVEKSVFEGCADLSVRIPNGHNPHSERARGVNTKLGKLSIYSSAPGEHMYSYRFIRAIGGE